MTLFAELGMRYPVIQAPMAGVQNSALAMAATSAGALGSLPAAMLSGAELRQELSRLAASGPGPYNINFFCHRQHEPEPAAEQRWRRYCHPITPSSGWMPLRSRVLPLGPPSMTSMRPCLQSSNLPWSASTSACPSLNCLPR